MADGEQKQLSIHIDTATLFKFLLLTALLVLLFIIRDVIIIVLFSVVIASAINPVVRWLQERGIPRAVGVFIIYILLFALLVALLYVIINPLSEELGNLSETIPLYFDRLSLEFQEAQATSPQYEELLNTIQSTLGNLAEALRSFATNIFAAVTRIFGGLATAVIVIVISFYLAAEERGIPLFLRAVTPARHHSYVLNLWAAAQNKIGGWLRGQIILSLSVGIAVYIGLAIFGIRFKLILALLAAVFELVPFIGPVLAAIPAVLLAFLKSPVVALWTVVVYVIVQQLESNILAPKVMQRAVGLNPVVVIVSLLIGGKLLGIVGFIIAIPVAAVVVEAMRGFGKERDRQPIRP